MKKRYILPFLLLASINMNALENVVDKYRDIEDKALNSELCQMGFISFYKKEYTKSEKFLTKCLRVKETSYEEKQKAKFYLLWQVFQGKVLNFDSDMIERYLYDLSKEGSMQSQYLAGMMYLNGKGVQKDYRKSALYFRNASQSIFHNMIYPDNINLLNKGIKLIGVKSYNKTFDMKFTLNDKVQIFNNLNVAFELRTNEKDLLKDYSSYIKENIIDLFKSYDYKYLVEKDSKDLVKKDIKIFLNKKFSDLDFPDNIIDEVLIVKFYFDI